MLKVLHLPKHLSHCVSVVCVSFLLDSKYLDSVCMWVCALVMSDSLQPHGL